MDNRDQEFQKKLTKIKKLHGRYDPEELKEKIRLLKEVQNDCTHYKTVIQSNFDELRYCFCITCGKEGNEIEDSIFTGIKEQQVVTNRQYYDRKEQKKEFVLPDK
jgi:hypothetical protein